MHITQAPKKLPIQPTAGQRSGILTIPQQKYIGMLIPPTNEKVYLQPSFEYVTAGKKKRRERLKVKLQYQYADI